MKCHSPEATHAGPIVSFSKSQIDPLGEGTGGEGSQQGESSTGLAWCWEPRWLQGTLVAGGAAGWRGRWRRPGRFLGEKGHPDGLAASVLRRRLSLTCSM